jgi:hypothetical protein
MNSVELKSMGSEGKKFFEELEELPSAAMLH